MSYFSFFSVFCLQCLGSHLSPDELDIVHACIVHTVTTTLNQLQPVLSELKLLKERLLLLETALHGQEVCMLQTCKCTCARVDLIVLNSIS